MTSHSTLTGDHIYGSQKLKLFGIHKLMSLYVQQVIYIPEAYCKTAATESNALALQLMQSCTKPSI